MARIELTINGQKHPVEASPRTTLLTVLREQVGLTGTRYGCGEGECGACTVLIQGNPRRSCVTPARSVTGQDIMTIEGLAQSEKLHPVQEAFLEEEALQCGFCTSGMIMSAVGLLQDDPNPDRERVLTAMNGNICRCGTYPRILQAIQKAASRNSQTGGQEND